MSEVFFYHLTNQPLEHTLPKLLGLAQKAGWRIAIRGKTAERLTWLDDKLWQGDGFMPHGVAGGEFDADQPILLTQGQAGNAPDCLIAIDGADLDPAEVGSVKRAMILFDGNSGDAVAFARTQWKAMTDADVPAKYWSQENGPWEMKAQHPA